MNERIQKLAKQANANFSDGLDFSVVFGEMEDFEKFVELIVLECASVAGRYVYENKYKENGFSEFLLKASINEHFGVE
jgi:hypothetical protein